MRTAIALMIVLGASTASGQTRQDSWHGTWTLNLAKSTYNASPPPKAASAG